MLGESKSDMEICWELGRQWNDTLWPGETLEEFFTFTMKETGMTFEEARAENWIYPEYHYEKFRTGEQRPDGNLGFNTPTGRIELYSTLFGQWGQKPVPHYAEPPYSPNQVPERFDKDEYLAKYPLIMTHGRAPLRVLPFRAPADAASARAEPEPGIRDPSGYGREVRPCTTATGAGSRTIWAACS